MKLRNQGLLFGAFFALALGAVLLIGSVFDPRKAPDYDPILEIVADENLYLRYQYTDEFEYLCANFDRYRPLLAKWALTNDLRIQYVTFDAISSADEKGVDLLIELTETQDPVARAEVVRQLGLAAINNPVPDRVHTVLEPISKENTMAGYYAHLGIINSNGLSDELSPEERAQEFRDRGLDPICDRALFRNLDSIPSGLD